MVALIMVAGSFVTVVGSVVIGVMNSRLTGLDKIIANQGKEIDRLSEDVRELRMEIEIYQEWAKLLSEQVIGLGAVPVPFSTARDKVFQKTRPKDK